MALPESFLDELRARLTLSSVIGARVKLTRKGREHHGLCPFHNEKTPSFTVNDDKGFFHCFGCGAHGDVITFEMRAANLPFREAVDRLASLAGLEIPRDSGHDADDSRDAGRRKAARRELMARAASFFEQALRRPEGQQAARYLERRGVSPDLAGLFRLGYAPGGNALRAALLREDTDEAALIDLGLLTRPSDGRAAYDTFRDRVIFPITDAGGRIVAFGGRLLGDGQPKYLNSPDTALFHKGKTLYNLPRAREAARTAGTLVVAEGYMDVIALTRVGLGHAVAPLGTALTEAQMELLWQTTPEPVLCFDGDGAGQRAAARALERALPLLKPGRGLRFALLPPGRDPDDLAREGGQAALARVLDAAQPLSEMAWSLLHAAHPLDGTPERRAALDGAIDAFVGRLADPTVQNHFKGALRNRFWSLVRETPRASPSRAAGPGRWNEREGSGGFRGRAPAGPRSLPPVATPLPALPRPERVREMVLLGAVLQHPWLFDHVGERLGAMAFAEPALDRLRQEVVMTLASEKALDRQGLQDRLTAGGFAAELATVLRPVLFVHAGFARETTDPALVRAGWDHTYGIHRRADLQEESRRAGERLKDQTTQDRLDLFLAVKQQDIWTDGTSSTGLAPEEDPVRSGTASLPGGETG
ncbi:DNA primase [Pararhodospirillum oryzae]|uniref:DNA primase n=1 Tax=Pararhodospirillum oryzae TaxID=478448 RepID=A0A512H469_9PROT|nr:DNA primase [Pararhodospirillum oryzae]GEO80255.1 DNA primase [Pararhodospirillum oryzae]